MTVMINGPKDTPYYGNKFQINIDIPDNYPKEPLACFCMQEVKHVNIEQKNVGPKVVMYT